MTTIDDVVKKHKSRKDFTDVAYDYLDERTLSPGRKTLATLFPFLYAFRSFYDAPTEADHLLEELGLAGKKGHLARKCVVTDYLGQERAKHGMLVGLAGVTETVDRYVTSMPAMLAYVGVLALQTMSTIVADITDLSINAAEESVELIPRAAFALYVRLGYDTRHHHHVWSLLAKDGLAAGAPIVGDLYEVATNTTVTISYEMIRREAVIGLQSDKPGYLQDPTKWLPPRRKKK